MEENQTFLFPFLLYRNASPSPKKNEKPPPELHIVKFINAVSAVEEPRLRTTVKFI